LFSFITTSFNKATELLIVLVKVLTFLPLFHLFLSKWTIHFRFSPILFIVDFVVPSEFLPLTLGLLSLTQGIFLLDLIFDVITAVFENIGVTKVLKSGRDC
jgi:hypothetical protein